MIQSKAERSASLKRQLARYQRRIDELRPRSNRYSWIRVVIFSAGVILSIIALFTISLWLFWGGLAITALLFGLAVHAHRQIDDSLQRLLVWQQLRREHLARAQLEWATMPTPRQVEPRYAHPFEADLDLVGPRSLHRLLDTTVTQAGSDRLRAWLTAPTPPLTTISARQALVRELIPRTLLRDKLTLYGRLMMLPATAAPTTAQAATGPTSGWCADALLAWLQQHPPVNALRGWLYGLSGLALINWILLGAYWLGWVGPFWEVTLALYALLQLWHARLLGDVFQEAAALQDELARLAVVFRQIERYDYAKAPLLGELCAPVCRPDHQPSQHLRRIAQIVAATAVQGNPVVALLLNAPAPWALYFAWRLSECKMAIATEIPVWLELWYELEALSALATFAYLNPAATFPHLMDAATREGSEGLAAAPIFQIQGLGHPLLPEEGKVRNDFTVDHLGEVMILTGSNMSGKSTFLRALGVNLALAYAGSVVDARQLTTVRFRLFTCIKVSDSVTDGISYFYAEVKRLKALLNALETDSALPLFYAIDEIFRGTNNRERLLGSQAYLRALVGQRGIGLIATHDLELVKLADEASDVHNYHFRDDLAAGRMVFDYQLRAGPCPTTNALRIMAQEGLPI
ncbi:MAG: hypothetical protein R3C14_34185 [Caldilineaceae bacterium]